jgi:hypothetical protein
MMLLFYFEKQGKRSVAENNLKDIFDNFGMGI